MHQVPSLAPSSTKFFLTLKIVPRYNFEYHFTHRSIMFTKKLGAKVSPILAPSFSNFKNWSQTYHQVSFGFPKTWCLGITKFGTKFFKF